MLSFLFNPWVISAGIATIAVVLILLSSFVSIRENQVGVVAKRFSPEGSLPEGRVVALKGEAGFQAATLPPGLHFPYWPWQYRISKYPITAIEQGYIGLVIANDGSPMPVDRVMSNVVDCDFFQDGVKAPAPDSPGSARYPCARSSCRRSAMVCWPSCCVTCS